MADWIRRARDAHLTMCDDIWDVEELCPLCAAPILPDEQECAHCQFARCNQYNVVTSLKEMYPFGGGDPELFKRLNEWRQRAKAWVEGRHLDRHEYVMAIDQYTEARLNICALRLAFSYIRGLERVGAPAILTQTLGAFRAKLTGGSSGNGA